MPDSAEIFARVGFGSTLVVGELSRGAICGAGEDDGVGVAVIMTRGVAVGVGSGEGVEITDLSGSGSAVIVTELDVVSIYFPEANRVTVNEHVPGKLAVTTPTEVIEQNPLELLLNLYAPVPSPPPAVNSVVVPIVKDETVAESVTGVDIGTSVP